MADLASVEDFLTGAEVDTAVFALRPDYRALLVAVDGLVPGPSDPTIEALLQAAETAAREALRDRPVEQLPAVAGRRTGRSAPSRNAPAIACRRSCGARRPGCPG